MEAEANIFFCISIGIVQSHNRVTIAISFTTSIFGLSMEGSQQFGVTVKNILMMTTQKYELITT